MQSISLLTAITNMVKLAIQPVVIAAITCACFGALYFVEGRWQHMPFVGLIIVFICSISYLIFRRIAFSTYLSLAIVSIATLMSIAKFRGKGFDLHVYDIAFTGSDLEALKFLASEYSSIVVPVLAALVMGVLGLTMVWRGEGPSRRSIGFRFIPLALSAFLLPLTYPVKSSEPRYFYYLSGFNASAFFVSFLDIADRMTQEPIVSRLSNIENAKPFETAPDCIGFEERPDIYVVLSESSTNFGNYPQVNLQTVPKDAFLSQDNTEHVLRVETFGGGTWVSNLALMTGLSTRDFGWRAPYLTVQLQERIQESLATLLNGCGYRSAVVMPMKRSFVNEGPFLKSIGFSSVLGYDEIGASLYNHRDSFYYNAADEFIEEHHKSDGRPLFLEVQTMFAHSPFDEPREPQIQFQSTAFVDNQSLNEHIRRVYIAQNDFHAFIERRKKLQPNRPFVVLEFGDHQALETQRLANEISGGNSLVDPDSIAYKTSFTLHSHNFDLDMRYFDWKQLDIGFLGVSFMQSIGVPLSPMYQELTDLRDHCQGRFADCADRLAVDTHLSRRIKSGLLALPNS